MADITLTKNELKELRIKISKDISNYLISNYDHNYDYDKISDNVKYIMKMIDNPKETVCLVDSAQTYAVTHGMGDCEISESSESIEVSNSDNYCSDCRSSDTEFGYRCSIIESAISLFADDEFLDDYYTQRAIKKKYDEDVTKYKMKKWKLLVFN